MTFKARKLLIILESFSFAVIVTHALLPLQCRSSSCIRVRKAGTVSTLFSVAQQHQQQQQPPIVWIQEAERDFVEEDENLEDGEVCLRAVKAFASSSSAPALREKESESPTPMLSLLSPEPRFLAAGALVQRPSPSAVCDAWTADAILEQGGPNLQVQGAGQILDDLLLYHLQRCRDGDNDKNDDKMIEALQTFVVKCGGGGNDDDCMESEYTCASYMAAKSRGFRPLADMIRVSSIYSAHLYEGDVHGLVLDVSQAKKQYQQRLDVDTTSHLCSADMTSKILSLLPDEECLRRYTTKRFTSKRKTH